MIRYGKAPFLECSSKGDRRFSAYFARVSGETIEARYQAAKIIHKLGGYPERCVHARTLGDTCKSRGRA
jgi:hypothetical protein